MELRPRRPLLVVADAGNDQDRVAAGPHDEAVKAEDQFAGSRLEQARAEQGCVFANHGGIKIREEIGRIEKWTFIVGDAIDLECTDADGLHLSSLGENRYR